MERGEGEVRRGGNLDGLDRLVAILVGNEHAKVGCVGSPPLAPLDVPGISDHQFEVVVAVDRGGYPLRHMVRRDVGVYQ